MCPGQCLDHGTIRPLLGGRHDFAASRRLIRSIKQKLFLQATTCHSSVVMTGLDDWS
jgi:hypothetical protein